MEKKLLYKLVSSAIRIQQSVLYRWVGNTQRRDVATLAVI